MEIIVKMDTKEFREYLCYRDDKEMYEDALKRIEAAPFSIASSLLNAVELAEGECVKWEIASQEHMDDAVNMAEKYLEAIEEHK